MARCRALRIHWAVWVGGTLISGFAAFVAGKFHQLGVF